MKIAPTLALLAAFACGSPLLASSLPRIVTVLPAGGGTTGGTLVAITTENLTFDCIVCSPASSHGAEPFTTPPPPAVGSVFFDGNPAQDVRTVSGSIVYAVAPPHAAGTVDVTVWGHEGSAVAARAFTYVEGRVRSDYEALLIPSPLVSSSNPLPGAHGSLWATDFWMRNNGPTSTLTYFGEICPLCASAPAFPWAIDSQQTVRIAQPANAPGLMLYVQKSNAAWMSYSLRARDLSRSAQNDGTAVPIVHEAQLTAPLELLDVPINATSRAGLRVFNVDALGNEHARVNVYSLTDPDFYVTALVPVTLSRPVDDRVRAGFPAIPGYGSIDDLRFALSLPDGNYRVEVNPLGFKGWAFVAVTNDETQLVTTVAP